jgi:hypothetical protein
MEPYHTVGRLVRGRGCLFFAQLRSVRSEVLRMLICVDDGKLGLGLSLLWYKPTQCWSLVVVVEL